MKNRPFLQRLRFAATGIAYALRTESSARGKAETSAAACTGARRTRTAPKITSSSSIDSTAGSTDERGSPSSASTAAINPSNDTLAG